MAVRRETLTRERVLPKADWSCFDGTTYWGIGKNFTRNAGYTYKIGTLGETLYKWVKKRVEIEGKKLTEEQSAEMLNTRVKNFPGWIPSIVKRLGLKPHQIKPVTELVKKDFVRASRQTE